MEVCTNFRVTNNLFCSSHLQEADDALLRNLEHQIQSQFLQDDINSTRERHKKVGDVYKCPTAHFLYAAVVLKCPIWVPICSHWHI